MLFRNYKIAMFKYNYAKYLISLCKEIYYWKILLDMKPVYTLIKFQIQMVFFFLV